MASRTDLPGDSVLRRHVLAARQAELETGLGPRPTDSVLRRHYDAALSAGLAAMVSPVAAGLASSTASAGVVQQVASKLASEVQPAATRAVDAAQQAVASPPSPGGFFGWLKRLFGG